MNQASREKELLNTARDCFRFVTKFFEPINVSAVHIYHSALELSPLSSIVRRLYYHQRPTPFPRVVAGIQDAWDECISLNAKPHYSTYTWSPCGRFIAARAQETVDIRDPLSSELLSTLIRPNASLTGQLAYSPDGHSLASHSSTSLIIWDIQTGGVAREIECGVFENVSLTWSLDQATICAILSYPGINGILQFQDYNTEIYIVHVYDVASGTTSPSTLQSRFKPHLWAHSTSFRAITVEQGEQAITIDISEVGSVRTKVESFYVKPWDQCDKIGSFSPTTRRISISNSIRNQLRVLDVRKPECLLEVSEGGKHFDSNSHCFSSDGSLFAASSFSGVHTWKYTSGRYTLWREFPVWNASAFDYSPPQFSPASSSILGHCGGSLQVWRLDSPPIVAHPNSREPLAVISHCGTYITTCYPNNSTVTITNLLSPTPSQSIDTDMHVYGLALTGNVLLVEDGLKLVAWRLTKNGIVDGVSAGKRAGRGDSIWTVSARCVWFLVEDQIVVIKDDEENVIHVYHTGTGEVLEPAQASLHPRGYQYHPAEIQLCQHYLHYRDLGTLDIPSGDEWPVTLVALEEGWVKDLEGKHRMWVPVEWRADLHNAGWLRNTTLLLYPHDAAVIVRF